MRQEASYDLFSSLRGMHKSSLSTAQILRNEWEQGMCLFYGISQGLPGNSYISYSHCLFLQRN